MNNPMLNQPDIYISRLDAEDILSEIEGERVKIVDVPPTYLTHSEAARALALAPHELRRMLRVDGVPVVDLGSKAWRVDRELFDQWCQNGADRDLRRSKFGKRGESTD